PADLIDSDNDGKADNIEVEAYVADAAGNTSNSTSVELIVDLIAPSIPIIAPRETNTPVWEGDIPGSNLIRVDRQGSATITSSTDEDTSKLSFTYIDEVYNPETKSIGIKHDATVIRDDNGTWQWLTFDGKDATNDPSAIQSAINLNSRDINGDGIDEAEVTIALNRLSDSSDITAVNFDIAGNKESSTAKAAVDDNTVLMYSGSQQSDISVRAELFDNFSDDISDFAFLLSNGEFSNISEDSNFEILATDVDNDGVVDGYGFQLIDENGPAGDSNIEPNTWNYNIVAINNEGNQLFENNIILSEIII
ncbi:hypothetical protein, partial [Psychrobacter lutiphocae]|uniref:hypothetical protein n=1 Tax=Psychrobacter lutiphocae TaxID=540500 RepID=UPI000524D2DA